MKRRLDENHDDEAPASKAKMTSNLSLSGTRLQDIGIDALTSIINLLYSKDIMSLLASGCKFMNQKLASSVTRFRAPVQCVPQVIFSFSNLKTLTLCNFHYTQGSCLQLQSAEQYLSTLLSSNEIAFPKLTSLTLQFAFTDFGPISNFFCKLQVPNLKMFTLRLMPVAYSNYQSRMFETGLEETTQSNLFSSLCTMFTKVESLDLLYLELPHLNVTLESTAAVPYCQLLGLPQLSNLHTLTIAVTNMHRLDDCVLSPIPKSCLTLSLFVKQTNLANPHLIDASDIEYLPRSLTQLNSNIGLVPNSSATLEACLATLPRSLTSLYLGNITQIPHATCLFNLPPSVTNLTLNGSMASFYLDSPDAKMAQTSLRLSKMRVLYPCSHFWEWLPRVFDCSYIKSLIITPSAKTPNGNDLTALESSRQPYFASLQKLVIGQEVGFREYGAIGRIAASTNYQLLFASMPQLVDLTMSYTREIGPISASDTYTAMLAKAPTKLERLTLNVGDHPLYDCAFGLPDLVGQLNFPALKQLCVAQIASNNSGCVHMNDQFVHSLPQKLQILKIQTDRPLYVTLSPRGWASFPHSLRAFELDALSMIDGADIAQGFVQSLSASCRVTIPRHLQKAVESQNRDTS